VHDREQPHGLRIPVEEAKALGEAVEGRQRFESLSKEFIELTVAAIREEKDSKKNSTKPSGKRGAVKRKPS